MLMAVFTLSLQAFSQNFTQTVRGAVLDAESKTPLYGVQVTIANSSPLIGTTTDENGEFRFEKVAVGRITLQFSYLGYTNHTLPDIAVIAGKETILSLNMEETITNVDEVVVTATQNKGNVLNEMSLSSSRSISSDETNRYAGGFNDPARILSNFAGVNNSQDGSADIIVRGNAPKYLQWRLEGIQITNPYHFADPSGLGNSASALNNNILATSDFYTGAFPAEFGDALSGVYDVKLRTGNNEKFESIVGLGLIGTDVTFEGPFKKGYKGSYVFNYRFTTISIMDKLGLFPDIGGVPSFQDGAFKVVLPTKKIGTFSLFGLSGSSSISFKNIDPAIWTTPGTGAYKEDIKVDFKKNSHLVNTGLKHTIAITKNSYLNTTLAYSNNGISDKTFETQTRNDSVIYARDNFKSKTSNSTYRLNISYHNKLNARNSIQIGSNYSLLNQNSNISNIGDSTGARFTLVDFNENISIVRNFVSWKYRINSRLTTVVGIHNMNVLLNNKSTVEPRVSAHWQINSANALNFGYGMHSTMESIHNYYAKVQMPDGSITEPNKNLDLLKAHHFVLGYENRLSKNLRAKIEVYYQHLYDLPVENNDSSSYATINESLDIKFLDLVNKGTGKNYGVEITLERFFANNYYFLINASLFNSKYKALDGVERNTAFNSNYLVNFLFGKDFTKLGKKQNKTFAINTKLFVGGGKRIIPLLRDGNGNLAVDPVNDRYYDNSKAYNNYIDDIYTLTVSFSYKWDKPKRTHELFLNIDNITNNKPRLNEYYSPKKASSIGYTTPFGIFPNLMYRIYF